MTVRMERDVFEALGVNEVGHACFTPMVSVYQAGMRGRGGKEIGDYRTEFFGTLLPGQRALFLFFTYYDHAVRSEDELYRISAHYLSAQIFGAVKKGTLYFHAEDMLRLLSQIEQMLSESTQEDLAKLYHRLQEISPHTLALIGAKIKGNPADFICLE